MLASVRFVGAAPYPGGEYYALLLFSGVGMLFMVSGNNLISIYVSLELMALSSYILAGYFKGELKSTEAALKYFILGAFSSGVLLYGLSLVYGVAGIMGLPELAKLFAAAERSNLLILGILLLLAGLLFKIAAVPFHVWTPDVYEGVADAGDGVLLGRAEGRGLRDPGAHLLRRVPEVPRRLGPHRGARVRGDHDPRQRRGAAADQRQAHARLLVDRERGLRAARRPRLPHRVGPVGDPGLPARVHAS